MNKLVSKNPVQRFKEGRKILKGADGLKANEYGEQAYFLGRNGRVFKGHIDQSPENKRLTQRYTLNGKQYGSFDGGKQYYDLSSLKPLNQKSNSYLLAAIDRGKNPRETVSSNGEVTGKTGRTGKDWKAEYTNNFLNTLSNDEITHLKQAMGNDNGYLDPSKMQEFLIANLGKGSLGNYGKEGVDGRWGSVSRDAWELYKKKYISTPKQEEIFETPAENNETPVVTPTKYTTNNTYMDKIQFRDNIGGLGIQSNADLINWMHQTGAEGYDFGGNQWAKQFRSDVDRALGGDYSDANIRKTFNTAGNWGRGFLGGGDLSDFQNAMATNAGMWNGAADAGKKSAIQFDRSATREWLRNNAGGSAYAFTGDQRKAVRNILNGQGTDQDKELIKGNADLAKALTGYFKTGGNIILPSRNIVERFKNGRKIDFFQNGGVKRFKVSYKTRTGGDWLKKEFDTQEEVNSFRKRLSHVPVFKVDDMKGASENSVVKSSRVKGKDAATTSYDRQQAEKYNHLSREEAYKEAQKSGKNFFAYQGKVYKTDLKNGENNIDEMIAMYGNNLGWDNHPKLQTKQSREARKQYRSQLGAKTQEIRVTMPNVNALGIRKGNAFQQNISYNVPNGAIEYTGEDGKQYWMRQNHSTGEFVFGDRSQPISYAKTPVPEGYVIPGTNIKISKGLNIGGLNLQKKWF